MAVRLVPDIRQGNRRKLDVVGVVLAAMTLVCLTFALTEGQRYDWGVGIWALLGGAALLLGLFLIHQRARQHDEPLLPFVLFRDRDYAVMSFVAATVQVGMLGLFLPVMIYLQSVLHFSALTAGLVMAPAMVVSAVLSPVSGRMADRIGGKYVLMTGLTLFACGMAWLTWVTDVGRAWWEFQPALIMSGVGIGCVFGPMVTVAMYNVEPAMAGAASGVLNTIRQVGTVFGSAAVGAVLQNRLAVSLQDEAAERAAGLPADVRGPFLAGFRDAARSGQEAGCRAERRGDPVAAGNADGPRPSHRAGGGVHVRTRGRPRDAADPGAAHRRDRGRRRLVLPGTTCGRAPARAPLRNRSTSAPRPDSRGGRPRMPRPGVWAGTHEGVRG